MGNPHRGVLAYLFLESSPFKYQETPHISDIPIIYLFSYLKINIYMYI